MGRPNTHLYILIYYIKAPIIPKYRHPGDTGNFEKYPDTIITDRNPSDDEDAYKNLFVDFCSTTSTPS